MKRSIGEEMQNLRARLGLTISKHIMVTLAVISCLILTTLSNQLAYAQKAKNDSLIYTVQQNDFLVKIATNYGNPNFWQVIYEANRSQINDPDLIYPGQELLIPLIIRQSEKFIGSKASSKDSLELTKFREAFNKLVQEETLKDAEHNTKSQYNGLEFGGLVINETRSKLGRDFFSIFYRFWSPPPNSPNFLLAITEKPIPSMGTLITVNLDNQPIFRSRLQPRYEIIEDEAKRAVTISYRTLQQKLQTEKQLIQY